MADCKTCEHKGTNTHYCDECSSDYDMYERKIVTNADKIRSMSDEELAEFLCDISKCESGYCPSYDTCMRTEHGTMKNWLQSEVE